MNAPIADDLAKCAPPRYPRPRSPRPHSSRLVSSHVGLAKCMRLMNHDGHTRWLRNICLWPCRMNFLLCLWAFLFCLWAFLSCSTFAHSCDVLLCVPQVRADRDEERDRPAAAGRPHLAGQVAGQGQEAVSHCLVFPLAASLATTLPLRCASAGGFLGYDTVFALCFRWLRG